MKTHARSCVQGQVFVLYVQNEGAIAHHLS